MDTVKITTLFQRHEQNFEKANEFFKMDKFIWFNPKIYQKLLTDLSKGKIDKREYLSRLLDVEKEQDVFKDYLFAVVGDIYDLNFTETWELNEALIMAVVPNSDREKNLLDNLEAYTRPNNGTTWVGDKPTKDEIIEWLLSE